MAGNGVSLVRPKTEEQNSLRILAGSPLAVQGVFLEIIRERFTEVAGIDWIWRPELTETDILIETSYNEEIESRSQTPAVYINRLETIPSKQMIGDRVGVQLKDHLEGQGALTTVQISIDCVSPDEGESSIIGDIVQFMLIASQDIIQREFGFHDMSHATLGQTAPFEQDKEKWNTPIAFYVQFWIRWTQVPISPLLQQIAQRITSGGKDATGHFVSTVLNSTRRGEILDPSLLADGQELPPSRISIVGPVGPQGPEGAPGPAGQPGASEALAIDQLLTGVINGVNTVYITSTPFKQTAVLKEMFYVNGVRQNEGASNDYTVSESVIGGGFDTVTMLYTAKVGDILTIDYYPDTP